MSGRSLSSWTTVEVGGHAKVSLLFTLTLSGYAVSLVPVHCGQFKARVEEFFFLLFFFVSMTHIFKLSFAQKHIEFVANLKYRLSADPNVILKF